MNKRVLNSSLSALLLALGTVALAQPPQPPPQGPPPQGPPPQGAPGFGGANGNVASGGIAANANQTTTRTMSVAALSLRTLAAYLGITDDQKGKIAQIREDAQLGMQSSVGNQGVRTAARQRAGRVNAGAQQATDGVAQATVAVLNEMQRNRLNVLLQALQTLQTAGVRPEAALSLQLTDQQLLKLASFTSIAPGEVESVLSQEQIAVAQQYRTPNQAPATEVAPPPTDPGAPPSPNSNEPPSSQP